MVSSIDTAIPLHGEGLQQPLIPKTEIEDSTILDVETGNDHEVCKTETSQSRLNRHFLRGFWLGFIIQTLSLGSTALLALYSGVPSPESTTPMHHGFLYFLLVLLSQAWWLLFPAIFVAINEGLSTNLKQGVVSACLKKVYHTGNVDLPLVTEESRRESFLSGVRFHVGVVFGCFIVWSFLDIYFGASIDIFGALVGSFVGCLCLCYSMVVVYDLIFVDSDGDENEQ